jgi:hypothetical protein
VSKRYGAATRFFCGLLGTFSLLLLPVLVVILAKKALSWPLDTSILTFIFVTPTVAIVGALFVFIGIKGHEPEWWREWVGSRLQNR